MQNNPYDPPEPNWDRAHKELMKRPEYAALCDACEAAENARCLRLAEKLGELIFEAQEKQIELWSEP